MSIKCCLAGKCVLRTVGLNGKTTFGGEAKTTGRNLGKQNKKLVVNNRNLGQPGELSHNFGSESLDKTRQKMQLKNMITRSKIVDYSKNPIMERRMKQKIAQKTSELYGISVKKLLGREAISSKSSNYGGNQSTSFAVSLRNKINHKSSR